MLKPFYKNNKMVEPKVDNTKLVKREPMIDYAMFNNMNIASMGIHTSNMQSDVWNTIHELNMEKARKTAEMQENIRRSAKNSDEIVGLLETQIKQKDEDLANQRQLIAMLNEKLIGINRSLSDLFILEENNQDILNEANELSAKMLSEYKINGKMDLKSVFVDKGIDFGFIVLQIIISAIMKK